MAANIRSDIGQALLKYDSNKDNILTAKEISEAIKKIDKNSNGLDIKEAKELIGDIELPLTKETPFIYKEDVKQLNNIYNKSKSEPNSAVFNITKEKDKQFKLSDCKKVIELTNKDITYVADRYKTPKDLANSLISIPFVAFQRIENGMPTGNLTLKNIYDKANISKKHKAGNCMEMACVAFTHAKDIGAKKVELFSVENHMFVVINRSDKVRLDNDPRTWGSSCMIIDPWSKKTFPASEFFKQEEMKIQQPFFEGPFENSISG